MTKPLERLLGSWTTEASHPALPGVIVQGSAEIEWLEGEHFLIQRTRMDHPDFPDAISIIGHTDQDRVSPGAAATKRESLNMHYYDSRGVSRVYQVRFDANAYHILRMSPGFSQRFTGTFEDAGRTIVGLWQMSEDGQRWHDDLRITFRKR